MKTTYNINVSTGAEINQHGTFALFLTVTSEAEVEGAAHVWEPRNVEPDDLDLDVALDFMVTEYRVPRSAWVVAAVDPSVVSAQVHGWVPLGQTDEFGGFTIARAELADADLLAWPDVRLHDADTAEYIGPATIGQVTASILAEDTDGGCGIILIDDTGTVVVAGSWDAEQNGVRRVYTAE